MRIKQTLLGEREHGRVLIEPRQDAVETECVARGARTWPPMPTVASTTTCPVADRVHSDFSGKDGAMLQWRYRA